MSLEQAKQMELVRTKQDIVKNSHKEREIYAQACPFPLFDVDLMVS